MSAIRGYPSQQKLERTNIQFVTVEPVHKEQNGASVVAHQFVYSVGTDSTEAGTTAGMIVAAAHAALEGDVIRLTSGAQSGKEIKVVSVSANEINLAEDLPSAIASGVSFEILRHKYPSVDANGNVNVNAVIVEEALSPDGGALPAQVKVAGGYDGTNVHVLKTDAAGELQVDVLSSALPSGAATEATLGTLATEATVSILGTEATLQTLATEATVAALATEATVSTLGTEATLADIKTAVELLDNAVSGNELQVDVVTSALPVGAATETTLLAVEADTTALAGCVSGSELQVDVVTSALPTGAATEATLAAIQTAVELIDDCVGIDGTAAPSKSFVIAGITSANVQQTVEVNASGHVHVADGGGSLTVDATSWPLPTGAATEVTLSALNGKVTACNTGAVTISSSALPAGAATEATLSALNGKVTACDTGSVTISTALPAGNNNIGDVDLASAIPAGTNTIGKVDVNTLSVIDLLDAEILDTSSTNIAGSASLPTQVVVSTAAATKKLQLLDTTGAFIGVYTGGAGVEVLQLIMGPGSDQTIEHAIPAATRVSLKRLDSTTAISSGIVAINFIG